MNRILQFGLNYGLLLIVVTLAIQPAQAASNEYARIVGWSSGAVGDPCSAGTINQIDYSFLPGTNDNDASNPNQDFVAVTLKDGLGVPLDVVLLGAPVNTSIFTSSIGNGVLAFGVINGAINDITARPITMSMYDTSFGPSSLAGSSKAVIYQAVVSSGELVVQESFDPYLPPVAIGGIDFCGELPVITGAFVNPPSRPYVANCPGDGTLNLCITSPDNNGEQDGLDFWAINEQGRGYQAFYVSNAELAEFPDKPDENIEIATSSDGNIILYKLTTGEYQVNIGPDREGKVQVLIFTGVPPTNIYRKDFNIYDISGK